MLNTYSTQRKITASCKKGSHSLLQNVKWEFTQIKMLFISVLKFLFDREAV